MKKKAIGLSFLLLATLLPLKAQLAYHDASQFALLGKASTNTETLYERLPKNLKGVSRGPVWNLGKNTAGLSIRFSSNTSSVAVKWTLYEDVSMNHMTPTGVKGLDLYCLEGDKWVFVNSARPKTTGKQNQTIVISNMEQLEREFLLYLPLYDGIVDLQIGVDSLAHISDGKAKLPLREKPIVAYGTSILQGGCASRPGMAHTNILSRWLNKEFINLGFSGNGQLDYEIAELMADIDASVFILDFMPNVNVAQIEEKMEKFYSIIRAKSPNIPIMFVENPIFPQATYDSYMKNVIEEKNQALLKVFNELKKNDEHTMLLLSEAMIGLDKEATVDGIHFTDLGFMRYAEFLYPTLKEIVKNEK